MAFRLWFMFFMASEAYANSLFVSGAIQNYKNGYYALQQGYEKLVEFIERNEEKEEELRKTCDLNAVSDRCNEYVFLQQIKFIIGQSNQILSKEAKRLNIQHYKPIDLQTLLRLTLRRLTTDDSLSNSNLTSEYINERYLYEIGKGIARSKIDRAEYYPLQHEIDYVIGLKADSQQSFDEIRVKIFDDIRSSTPNISLALNILESLKSLEPFTFINGEMSTVSLKTSLTTFYEENKNNTAAEEIEHFIKLLEEVTKPRKFTLSKLLQHVTKGALNSALPEFLDVYMNFESPYKLEEIKELVTALCNLTSKIGKKANRKHDPEQFTKLLAMFNRAYVHQFTLIDVCATKIGAILAKKFINACESTYECRLFKYINAITIQQARLQEIALLACNLMEYKNGGIRPYYCKSKFVSVNDMNMIKGNPIFDRIRNSRKVTRMYKGFIPTSPKTVNDFSFVDLNKLVKGEKTYFSIPNNRSWLIDQGFISRYDSNKEVYKLLSMDFFIPLLNCGKSYRATVTTYPVQKLNETGPTYLTFRRRFWNSYKRYPGYCMHDIPNPAQSNERLCQVKVPLEIKDIKETKVQRDINPPLSGIYEVVLDKYPKQCPESQSFTGDEKVGVTGIISIDTDD